ncbi:MAG: M17 family peptidase N-terminal domain-containing protein, partial [Rothia sp. (in: high G+C Gram-positive bacteria)]|nr:M17 family peptidase N-terminal domain-containing protein [Rothia sp. (in: high G+C Gram-positive bacteria)]
MSESHDLSFSVAAADLESLDAGALVLGVYSTDDGPALAENPLDAETAEGLEAILEDLGVTGGADELTRLPGIEEVGAGVLALIGLGKQAQGET